MICWTAEPAGPGWSRLGKRIDKIPSVITDALVAGSDRLLLHLLSQQPGQVNISPPLARLAAHWEFN